VTQSNKTNYADSIQTNKLDKKPKEGKKRHIKKQDNKEKKN
jgi:hypothetical protein